LSDQTPEKPETKPARPTNLELRVMGCVALAGGIYLTTLTDYVVDGFVPAPYLGYVGIVCGILFLLFPGAFRAQFAAFYSRRN
jgi:uncharacterized protein YjeT (DUF2065 family)